MQSFTNLDFKNGLLLPEAGAAFAGAAVEPCVRALLSGVFAQAYKDLETLAEGGSGSRPKLTVQEILEVLEFWETGAWEKLAEACGYRRSPVARMRIGRLLKVAKEICGPEAGT